MIADPTTRNCGTCCLCCKLIPVRELRADGQEFSKPGYEWCPHTRPGSEHPCSVYGDRPASCALFLCGWRLGLGIEESRPDRCRVVASMDYLHEVKAMSLALYHRDIDPLTRTRGGRALLSDAFRPLRLTAKGGGSFPILTVIVIPGPNVERTVFVRNRELVQSRPVWTPNRHRSWRQEFPDGLPTILLEAQEGAKSTDNASLLRLGSLLRFVPDR